MTATLEDLIPKSIDDIIRRNRELVTLEVVQAESLPRLLKPIAPRRIEQDNAISDWRFIKLNGAGIEKVMLLGTKPDHRAWITSEVQQIDLDNQLVITKSGTLYALCKPGEGAPPFQHLAMICAAFNQWGFGEFLGVPPIEMEE